MVSQKTEFSHFELFHRFPRMRLYMYVCVWFILSSLYRKKMFNKSVNKRNTYTHFRTSLPLFIRVLSFSLIFFFLLSLIHFVFHLLHSPSSSLFVLIIYFDSSFRAASPISPRIFHMGLPAHKIKFSGVW